jgi:hemolysin III
MAFILIVSGGVLYSVGAVIFLIRRPDPFPSVFGYHELFHAFVVAATAMFYFVVVNYVMPL